jgi:hypothetical protein
MNNVNSELLEAHHRFGDEESGLSGSLLDTSIKTADADDTAEGAARLNAVMKISVDQIQSASPAAITRLKSLSGHGADSGVWETPSRWLVHGSRIESIGAADLRSAAQAGLASSKGLAEEAISSLRLDSSSDYSSIFRNLVEDALNQANRYLLLLRLGPSAQMGRQSGGASLKASSVAAVAAGPIRRMIEIVVRRRLQLFGHDLFSVGDRRNFALIRPADIDQLPTSFAKSCKAEIRRMQKLAGRGLWSDLPPPEQEPRSTVNPQLSQKVAEESDSPEPHLPLPDEYVAVMGQRSLWLTAHLGSAILEIGDRMLCDWRAAARRGHVSKDTRKQIALRCISAYFGGSGDGSASLTAPILSPPFKILLSTHGEAAGRLLAQSKQSCAAGTTAASSTPDAEREGAEAGADSLEVLSWPPRNLAHYVGLCAVLQGAHFFLVSIALAARQSESMDLRRTCVAYEPDGSHRAVSRTFKLVQTFEGEIRNWELPDAAVRAIEQQVRLVRLLEQMPWAEDLSALLEPEFCRFEGDHLWCRLGTGKTAPREVPRNPNKLLRRFARSIDMDTAPGGQSLRTHRFRKTIARLGALAVDEAPVMLKALFGHKDIEMTLHYILADKGLAAEIEQVIKELRMMRASIPVKAFVDAIAKGSKVDDVSDVDGAADYAGYGGGAVARIQDTITRYREQASSEGRMRNSSDDFGATQVDDVVRVLTADGTYFEAVRPGIICTKRLGEWGPCSRNKGQPDRSNCVETCGYRLEEPWHRRDVDVSISDSLDRYERARVEDDTLLMSFWAEQLRRNVVRFSDLRRKWMQHPTVSILMASPLEKVGEPS